MKDIENPHFSNSGAKVEIMWGYESGLKFYGVKMKFIENVNFIVIDVFAFFYL